MCVFCKKKSNIKGHTCADQIDFYEYISFIIEHFCLYITMQMMMMMTKFIKIVYNKRK